jgi:hypothetical protein
VLLTQGDKTSETPKYCNKPSAALKAAATHQAPATVSTLWSGASALGLDGGALIRKPTKAKAHAQEKNKGIAAGEGPNVNGLSQGRVMRKKAMRGKVSAGISDVVTCQVDLHRLKLAAKKVKKIV